LLTALSHLVQGESIIATALAVGYDNASAFSAMFKSYMHMTPSDYQAQVKAPI
jgi:AraC-like DNA-binding protein